MKIIRTILFSFLALVLIGSMGLFILFQTFDTDQYLSQITKKASLALGRPVYIGYLGLGLSLQGITLDAGPVNIMDDLDFTTQPFIKVDRVRVSLDLKSLVLQREIHITSILLQSPQIHFIRSQEGDINIRSIAQASHFATDVKRPNPINIAPFSSSAGEGKQSLNPVNRELFPIDIRIRDASISFIDQSQNIPLDIWLTGINASLKDLSLSKPFPISFDASLYSATHNVHAAALVSIDLSKRSVQISDLELNADFSKLDIDGLKGISPETRDSPIFKDIAGLVQINMENLEMNVSGGLIANGDISITRGVIKNFNIIKTILSRSLGAFTGIEGNIDSLLNGQFKDKLGADDTTIEKAQAKFSIHDKTVFIDDSLIQTNIFELTAKGSVDQGLNMDMQTMLHLNNDVSASLVNKFDGLKLLCDDSKRIAIGASLKGVIPHLKYKPDKDFRKKSKRALIEEGGNILGVLFGGGKQ